MTKLYPTSIGSLTLDHCIMNASGPICTTIEELQALKFSGYVGAIVTKSSTREPREGNPEPRWATVKSGGGIQSMGLPNEGYLAYIQHTKMLKSTGQCHPVIASVSGLSKADNIEMIKAFLAVERENGGVDAIELNLSCPNVPGKPQVGYDFPQMKDLLTTIAGIENIDTRAFGLKLPPYFDDSHFDEAVAIINEANTSRRFITFLTTINSIGNCLVLDLEKEQPIIKPKQGHGGLCGSPVKPVALANVRNFRKRFGDEMAIIGVGGVDKGSDIYEFLLVGADAVQIGAAAMIEGPSAFERLSKEFSLFMHKKGVENVHDVRKRLNFM